MFERLAKSYIVRWVKNPKNRKKAAAWLLPLAAWILRTYANGTTTKADDNLADVLDAWSKHI
jgi:hypothetical protein